MLASFPLLQTLLHDDIDAIFFHFATTQVRRRSPARVPCDKEDKAASNLAAFVKEKAKNRCPHIQALRNLVPSQLHRSKRLLPTSRIKKPIDIKGMYMININAAAVALQVPSEWYMRRGGEGVRQTMGTN